MKKQMRGVGFYIIVAFLICSIVYFISTLTNQESDYTYGDFLSDLKEENVESVVIKQNKEVPTGKLTIKLKNGEKEMLFVEDISTVTKDLKENDMADYKIKDVERESVIWEMIPYVIMIVVMIVFFSMISGQMGGGGSGGKMMNFGKSRAKLANDGPDRITFEKVAGLHEEKEELEEIVDFLKDPKKYINVGARIPKGVILTGPP